MTRSGAPFHGAHGEGRTAISPAASQAGGEPWARACPARARKNAPPISDNAVVATPMNWRAESTGDPLRLSRPATQLAGNHGKSRQLQQHGPAQSVTKADRQVEWNASMTGWGSESVLGRSLPHDRFDSRKRP